MDATSVEQCMETDEPTDLIELVVDGNSRRPFCVLVQATMGYGASNSFLSVTVDSKHWLLAPNDNMKVVKGTREQWQKYAQWLDLTYQTVSKDSQ